MARDIRFRPRDRPPPFETGKHAVDKNQTGKDLLNLTRGRWGLTVSWAPDGSWFIRDEGFCDYHEIIAITRVKGVRPWEAVQFVVGPLMMALYWQKD